MNDLPPTSLWYISKYFRTPQNGSPGGRGFYLLRELSRIGFQCTAIISDSNHLDPSPAFSEAFFTESIDLIEVNWIKTLKYQGANSFRRILSWIDFDFKTIRYSHKFSKRPDVIVASSLSLTSILTGLLLKLRYKAFLIFEIRDIWPLTLTEEGGFSRYNPFIIVLSWIERIGYRYSDAIVGTMPNLEPHVRKVSKSKKPVYCIPMGYVDPIPILRDSQELPLTYLNSQIPKDKFIVGYAGTIGVTNALEVLLEAAAFLSDRSDIHFVLVGSGDKLDEYKKLYSNLSNVSFAGSVPKELVQEVLKEFDVLYFSTFPSLVWEYGLSLNKLIDYMLSGKPIIASYSGFPSMLNESGGGVFVPAGDIGKLVSEIENFSRLPKIELVEIGQKGRDWLISHRSYATLAKDFQKILKLNAPIYKRTK